LRAEKTDLGIAAAAAVTGALMQWFGWRAAFALPGLARLALGVLFMRVVPPETESPAKRRGGAQLKLSRSLAMHALAVMTVASATGCILFNLATNGSGQLLAERFQGAVRDPATLGLHSSRCTWASPCCRCRCWPSLLICVRMWCAPRARAAAAARPRA
jgi:MFS family permease